jgi:TP901 family phage tail tape measure protein
MTFNIGFDIFAKDRATATFDKVGKSVDGAHRSFGNATGSAGKLGGALGLVTKLGVAGAMAGAGAAVLKLGTDSVTAEASFSQTMNTMGAVANVPKDQMKGLSDLALKMGADTTFSAGEAADAMLELAKGGLDAATIKSGALAGTLTLASAGGTDLATAATIASNALNTFNLKGKDMASVAAALAGGANASSASVESLGQGLQQVGPGATNAGLSLQDTIGTLSAFDAAGIKGADAGTSLKTMLVNLIPHSKAARNAMHDLGLKFTDATGKFLPITAVAQQLKDKLSGLSQEQRTTALSTIFGSDATRAATVLMNQGSAGLGKFIAATKDQNAAQNVAKSRMAGTAGALESFKGSVETAKLQLGLFIAPAVQAGLGALTKGINGIVPGVQKLAASMGGGLKKTMSEVMPKLKEFGDFAVQTVLPALGRLAKFIAETIGPVLKQYLTGALAGAKIAFDRIRLALQENEPQLKKLGNAIGEVVTWVAQKLGPILGWLAQTQLRLVGERIAGMITAIGKLVEAIGWTVGAIKSAGKGISDGWKAIGDTTKKAKDNVGKLLGGFWNGITTAWTAMRSWVTNRWTSFAGWIGGLAGSATKWLGSVWRGFWQSWDYMRTLISNRWGSLTGWVGGFAASLSRWMGSPWRGFATAWDEMRGWINTRWASLTKWVGGMGSGISKSASGMWDGIKNAFRNAINGIIGMWNNLSFSIPGLSVAGHQVFGGATISTPDISYLAKGGIVTKPTLAMIGEGRSDEAVIPLDRLNGLGGDTYNVSVAVPVGADLVGTGRAVVQAIKAYKTTTGNRELGIA